MGALYPVNSSVGEYLRTTYNRSKIYTNKFLCLPIISCLISPRISCATTSGVTPEFSSEINYKYLITTSHEMYFFYFPFYENI